MLDYRFQFSLRQAQMKNQKPQATYKHPIETTKDQFIHEKHETHKKNNRKNRVMAIFVLFVSFVDKPPL